MVPEKPSNQTQFDLFRLQLDNIINRNHELYRLAEMIDWSVFDESFDPLYCPNKGCPGKPTRLMVGLQMLKYLYGMSDEEVVDRWVENPYWQKFCGEVYFQHEPPIDPSSMTRYRKRIGESLSEVYISGQKRGITTQRLKRSLKRRQAIEPIIGHLKSDGLLGRNYLKGTLGDQMNVLLCCAEHNLRLILKRLRYFCLDFWGRFWAPIRCWEGANRLITEINSGARWLQCRSTNSFTTQLLPTTG